MNLVFHKCLNDAQIPTLKDNRITRLSLLQNTLHTCARLSYTPICLSSNQMRELLHRTLLEYYSEYKSLNIQLWIQTVWSLTLIDCVSPQLLESVLCPDFMDRCTGVYYMIYIEKLQLYIVLI